MSKFFAGEEVHVIPIIAPVDTGATTANSDVVGVKEAQGIQFILQFGVITGDAIAVTVEECSDTTPSASTAIAFKYRKSSAVNTDSMGALTAATATGVSMAATDDNKALLIDVDPAALTSGYPYLRVVVDPGASATVCLVNALALLKPRYPGATQPSMVD